MKTRSIILAVGIVALTISTTKAQVNSNNGLVSSSNSVVSANLDEIPSLINGTVSSMLTPITSTLIQRPNTNNTLSNVQPIRSNNNSCCYDGDSRGNFCGQCDQRGHHYGKHKNKHHGKGGKGKKDCDKCCDD